MNDLTEVVTSDLRALLFWATVGVAKAKGGSFRDIENIIESYAEHLKFKTPFKPKFGSARRKKHSS